ncbi:MAG: SirB2 family protein [Proteobacteria bacterium]|nr:SirB2 family protein [Pseudomonadota bacterium]
MTTFVLLKNVHVVCVGASLAGFLLRGYWALRLDPRLHHRMTRLLPHIVDTCLLLSALGMLFILRLNPLATAWLSAKIIALVAYILLGAMALKYAPGRRSQVTAFVLAIASYAYMLAVAISKSPLPG